MLGIRHKSVLRRIRSRIVSFIHVLRYFRRARCTFHRLIELDPYVLIEVSQIQSMRQI